ncbi:hypothetical protein HYX13_02680 [Candidatus Woesearchaeota archaeon]|nr:hypothetical protein [Candidatus Woesearchaeota archaeon]
MVSGIGILERIVNAVPNGCGYLGEKIAKDPVKGRIYGTGAGYALEVAVATAYAIPVGLAVAVASPVLYAVKKMKGEDKKK